MKYLIAMLVLAGCSEPFDISRVKAEAKHAIYRHKVVAVTSGNVTEFTVQEIPGK